MRYLYFFLVCFCFISCNRNTSHHLKFIIQCSKGAVIEIEENNIEKVIWDKQYFYLTEGLFSASDFNTKICYNECYLSALLGKDTLYKAALHCSIAPTSVNSKSGNVLFIHPPDRKLNLFYQNRLQLNLNQARTLSSDKNRQESLTSFMYVTKLKEYLERKKLLKRE